ncbi:hypothetical protein PV342_12415 [Streptomyces sp. PA03-3a]|nr:hypothetical protein [Streptomyces sp. PA03-3a]
MTTVYVTKQGDRHHTRPDCELITGAQKTAMTMGWNVHPPQPVSQTDAERLGKGEHCPRCIEVPSI